MTNDPKRDHVQDAAMAHTFPASDPPATTGTKGAVAVPVEELMASDAPAVHDAVTLRKRFPTTEAAKLALESLVREGPVDRNGAEIVPEGEETELRIAAPANDAPRLRELLARAS